VGTTPAGDRSGAATVAVARAVAGLAAPRSGRVFVGTREVTTLPPGSRQIGYVPRGGALFPHLTVRQNIEYLLWRQESVRGILRDWSAALIYQLELGPVLDQRPHEITAQQRLRAAVARAVMTLPEVLVLDRPDLAATGPLDELIARLESSSSPPPATVAFTGEAASEGGAAVTVVVA
jgi:ABC-type sugar transport system ATPase subunit